MSTGTALSCVARPRVLRRRVVPLRRHTRESLA